MEKRITMKQIADELGISINAVSLALNNKQGVSESTRKRVLRLANKTGYLDQSDKYNKTFSSKHICVLIRKIYFQDMHFYSRVIYGIQWQADRLGYDIIIHFTDQADRIPPCVQNKKVAGIIIVGTVEEDRIQALSGYGIPVIVVTALLTAIRWTASWQTTGAGLSGRQPSDQERLQENRFFRGS